MTDDVTADAAAVRDLALETLGLPETWTEPKGYRDSLALSAIDAVFSLQLRYAGVVNVLDRYRAVRRSSGANPYQDSGPDLLAVVEAAGGGEAAAATLFANRGVCPGTKVRKSTGMVNGVAALERVGVKTAADLREGTPSTQAAAKTAWLSVHGLGITSWDYLEMNVGLQGVKADTMVRRFVARAFGTSQMTTVDRSRAAVKGAADLIGVPYKVLDHAIWRAQSGRS